MKASIERRNCHVEGSDTHRHSITFGSAPYLQWVILHPTFDDHPANATTSKILKFSEHFGFVGARIVAVYDYRTNTSNGIANARKRFGDGAVSGSFELNPGSPVIVAWGNKITTDLDAVARVLSKMKAEGFTPKCLRRTVDGHPVQPIGISFPGPYRKLEDLQSYRPPLNIESRMK